MAIKALPCPDALAMTPNNLNEVLAGCSARGWVSDTCPKARPVWVCMALLYGVAAANTTVASTGCHAGHFKTQKTMEAAAASQSKAVTHGTIRLRAELRCKVESIARL